MPSWKVICTCLNTNEKCPLPRLNHSKTRKLVIFRNKPTFDPPGPSTLAGAKRVGSMRVLVEVGTNLSVGANLNVILSNSASSIHALRILRTQGLSQQ